jgi:glutathione S-transferase
MPEELILHEYSQSGNCYKIRLTAALLRMPLERREYDILKGETRTPEFLATINPNGRIPVLQVGARLIPESNAACFYLAEGSPLVPDDRFDRADMLRWMFFEQYNHEPNVATLRFWRAFVGEAALSEAQRAQIPAKEAAGAAALTLIDDHLAGRAPTSRSTLTPMSPMKAASISRPSPRSRRGSAGWRSSRAMCRWPPDPLADAGSASRPTRR